MNPAIAPAVKAALFSRWEPVHRSQLTYLVCLATIKANTFIEDHVTNSVVLQVVEVALGSTPNFAREFAAIFNTF